MQFATWIVQAAWLYTMAGLVIGLAFILFGLDRVDPGARRSWAFRPLLLPGFMLIWPLALWRWLTIEKSRASKFGD